jgi:hypothetical protein
MTAKKGARMGEKPMGRTEPESEQDTAAGIQQDPGGGVTTASAQEAGDPGEQSVTLNEEGVNSAAGPPGPDSATAQAAGKKHKYIGHTTLVK